MGLVLTSFERFSRYLPSLNLSEEVAIPLLERSERYFLPYVPVQFQGLSLSTLPYIVSDAINAYAVYLLSLSPSPVSPPSVQDLSTLKLAEFSVALTKPRTWAQAVDGAFYLRESSRLASEAGILFPILIPPYGYAL